MSTSDDREVGTLRPILDSISLAAVAFLVSLVAGVAFLVPVFALGYDVATTPVLLASTAVGQAAFLVVASAFVQRRGIDVTTTVPSTRGLLVAGLGTVAALVVAVALSAALSALGLLPESVIAEAAAVDPIFLLGLAVLSVVLVAPAEELLFRGAIQGRLRQRFGPTPAILGAGLLFGSMHLANYSGALGPVLAAVGMLVAVGCVFGAVYEYTGNLGVPILTHALYNVVLLVASYAAM